MTVTRRDCQHPRARHHHGTRNAYTHDGCRCFPCRIAHSNSTTVYRHGGAWTDGQFPHAIGVQRRIQALHANGWSAVALGQRLGISKQAVRNMLRPTARNVLQTTRETVDRLYAELWHTRPTGAVANRTRAWANAHGWHPPLAWDDDTIDNPHAWPLTIRLTGPYCDHCGHLSCAAARPVVDTIDDIAIEQAIGGRTVKLTKAERLEAVRRMTQAGMSAHQIGQRLRVTSRTVQRRRAA